MQELLSTPPFQIYLASVILLGFNLLALANNTALTRAGAQEVVNPEDEVLNKGAKVVYEAANDKTERYRRAHRNALENIPLFLITGFLLTLLGISQTVAAALFGVFVVARISHSVCYIRGIQPFRTLSFGIGAIDQAVVLIWIGYLTFMG